MDSGLKFTQLSPQRMIVQGMHEAAIRRSP